MQLLHDLFDLLKSFGGPHVLESFAEFIGKYGTTTYAILFAIIFCETGLVIMPFLPGDSLLFVVGVMCAQDKGLDATTAIVLLTIAAVIGDTVNYHIGLYIGPKVFTGRYRWLKKEHLDRAHAFYETYGGKAIVLARFVPIVRTFVPFVAGVARMTYSKFLFYNVVGGVVWVVSLVMIGVWFGEVEFVKKNIEALVIAIVFISILPMVVEFIRAKRHKHGEMLPNPDDMKTDGEKRSPK